jgi:hypothetical protein
MGSIIYGDAQHIIAQAKIDAARITQKSGNEKRGAVSNLQRFSASLSNQRALDAAGSNINDITGNISRNLDAAASGRLMSRVSAAEELGASVAMAAAAGVGGSSVEAYNATMRLTRSMQEEQGQRAVASDNFLASAQRGNQVKSAVASFDNSVYAADLDFNQYVDHKKMGLFTKILAVGATAAATYFGGPQAGQAVMGLFESRQAAQNGDFESASSSLSGAVKNGISAGGAFHKTGGQSGFSGMWDSVKGTVAASKAEEPVFNQRYINSIHIQ